MRVITTALLVALAAVHPAQAQRNQAPPGLGMLQVYDSTGRQVGTVYTMSQFYAEVMLTANGMTFGLGLVRSGFVQNPPLRWYLTTDCTGPVYTPGNGTMGPELPMIMPTAGTDAANVYLYRTGQNTPVTVQSNWNGTECRPVDPTNPTPLMAGDYIPVPIASLGFKPPFRIGP